MKKFSYISGLLLLLLSFSTVAFAEEGGNYESNAVTSFYGTYDPPPKKKEPIESSEIEKAIGEKQINQNRKQVLLATGSNHHSSSQYAGLTLLLTGFIIIFKERIK